MLDVSIAYNRYKFLGHEFLTWLWYVIENDPDLLKSIDNELVVFDIGNRIILENLTNDQVESVTIKGDDASLEEGVLALKKGAVVTEINLIYQTGDNEWRFSLKGESLNISGLKPPETGSIELKEDLEGAVLEKVYLYEKVITLLDRMFTYFIKLRISDEWEEKAVTGIRQWISG
ncbi:hypothetical protein QUF76_00700 [Desulfobacterales bacterium HSG16]|nr:hypothetical protein [Desulfobacterales bacterium HSG16]